MALPGSFSARETPVKPAPRVGLGWHGLGGLVVLWALGFAWAWGPRRGSPTTRRSWRRGAGDRRLGPLVASRDRRPALAGKAPPALLAGRGAGVVCRRDHAHGGAPPLGGRGPRAGPGGRAAGGPPVRIGDRHPRRRRPGHDGLDDPPGTAGRGRYPAGLPDHVDAAGVRPAAGLARAGSPGRAARAGARPLGVLALGLLRPAGPHVPGEGDGLRRGARALGRGRWCCSGTATRRPGGGLPSRPAGS